MYQPPRLIKVDQRVLKSDAALLSELESEFGFGRGADIPLFPRQQIKHWKFLWLFIPLACLLIAFI